MMTQKASKLKIRLTNGTLVDQDSIESDEVQNLLRYEYLRSGERNITCCCNEKKLRLVITYGRSSERFYIRRHASEKGIEHEVECRFRTESLKSTKEKKASYNITIPETGKASVADHDRLRGFMNDMFKIVMQVGLSKDSNGVISFKKVASLFLEFCSDYHVSGFKVSDIVKIHYPTVKSDKKELDLAVGRGAIILCELLEAFKRKNGDSIGIKIKGSNDLMWLNNHYASNLRKRQASLLLGHSGYLSSDRVFLMAFATRTASGKNIQAHSIALINFSSKLSIGAVDV
jgi:hypothetical protein